MDDAAAEQKRMREAYKQKQNAMNEKFNQEVKEVMEGLGVSKKEAERIVEEKDLKVALGGYKKKKNKIPSYKYGGKVKKKKTAKKMMGGGKVYSRGSRKASYNV